MGLPEALHRLSSRHMLMELVIGEQMANSQSNELGTPVLHLDDFLDAFVPGWVNTVYARMLGICSNASVRDEQHKFATAAVTDGTASLKGPPRLYSSANQWSLTFLHERTTAFAALPHAGKWKNLSMFANRHSLLCPP